MKYIIFTSIISTFVLQSQASAVTCQDQLKKIINRVNSPTYLKADIQGGGFGDFSIDVSVLAAIPLRLRAKVAKKSLAVLTDAEKGSGPALSAVWEKFNRKYSNEAKKLTLTSFAAAIHKADLEGTTCSEDYILKKRDYMDIVVDEVAKDCDINNSAQKLKSVTDEAINKLNQSKK